MRSTKNQVIIGLLAGLFILPLAYLLLLSFAETWRFPALLPQDWTAQQWSGLLKGNNEIPAGLSLSLVIALSVSIASTLLGFITSKWIAASKYRNRLLLLAYFPFVLSPVILAACIYFFFIKFGWSGTMGGVIAGQFFIAFPYAVILFVGYWNERLLTMEALSATMGATSRQTYTKVLLPVSKGILLVGFFQTFLISWFEYGLTSYLGVGKVPVLTVQVYQYIQEANPYLAALASALLILPPALLLWVNKRFVVRTSYRLEFKQ